MNRISLGRTLSPQKPKALNRPEPKPETLREGLLPQDHSQQVPASPRSLSREGQKLVFLMDGFGV